MANRLNDQDALDLAKALLAMDRNATPDEIRANPTLVAMAAKQPVRVPEANQAYVPALSPGRFNAFVKQTLSRSLEKAPPAFAVLAAATQDIVRTRLGEKGFANGKKLQDLVSTTHLSELLDTGDGAVEQFLFDEIAVNDAIPLESNDLEDVFGMRGNPAMRFIGLNYMQAMEDTLVRIPAEKRALLYAVFDAMTTLRRAPGEVVDETVGLNTTLTARVLKNYDAVAALRDAGNLDRQHIIELLFPDFPFPANATNKQIREIHSDAILKLMRTNPLLMNPVQLMMDSSGDTFEKVLDAVTKGRELPPAPYYSPISTTFAELDGTAEGGRKAMMKDLCRPAAPTVIATGQPTTTDNRFTVRFPDETVLHSTTGAEGDPNVIAANKRIADKIEGFCGPVHQRQIGAVFMSLSQSGLTPLTRGLVPHGVNSAEHAPVTYTLAKNPVNGAVTITYSEPAGFPFRFHWTVTVALDGTSSSTPMVVEK